MISIWCSTFCKLCGLIEHTNITANDLMRNQLNEQKYENKILRNTSYKVPDLFIPRRVQYLALAFTADISLRVSLAQRILQLHNRAK